MTRFFDWLLGLSAGFVLLTLLQHAAQRTIHEDARGGVIRSATEAFCRRCRIVPQTAETTPGVTCPRCEQRLSIARTRGG